MQHDAGAPTSGGWASADSYEDAVELCGAALYPHQKVGLLQPRTTLSFKQRIASVGPVTVGEMVFGAPVWMDCGGEHLTYHVNVALSGHLESVHRGGQLTVREGMAAIYQPQAETAIPRWESGRLLFVKIERSFVEDTLARCLGHTPAPRIDFDRAMSTCSGPGRGWLQLLLLLRRELFTRDSVVGQPLLGWPLVDALVRGLLVSADHPDRQALVEGSPRATPRVVRTAMDFIEAEAASPLTVSLLASQSHVSVRTLQDGFRRHLGTTPMKYLRDVRLRHVHEELLHSDPSVTTVTAVAHRWGFGNVGRFAAVYTARYGERPADTLRRQPSTYVSRSRSTSPDGSSAPGIVRTPNT